MTTACMESGDKRETTDIRQISATKHDSGKPDLALLPTKALEGISRAFMFGADIYGRDNYKKGMNWTRFLSAALRHITAFNEGKDLADDSKLNHLYHAGADIMILIEYYEKKLGKDDRYKDGN